MDLNRICLLIFIILDKMSTNGEMVVEDSNEMSLRTANFTTAKYLLINSADAIERIMTSYKEVKQDKSYLNTLWFTTKDFL